MWGFPQNLEHGTDTEVGAAIWEDARNWGWPSALLQPSSFQWVQTILRGRGGAKSPVATPRPFLHQLQSSLLNISAAPPTHGTHKPQQRGANEEYSWGSLQLCANLWQTPSSLHAWVPLLIDLKSIWAGAEGPMAEKRLRARRSFPCSIEESLAPLAPSPIALS